jgi:hypothetical protein
VVKNKIGRRTSNEKPIAQATNRRAPSPPIMTPASNAKMKAMAVMRISGRPLIASCDSRKLAT